MSPVISATPVRHPRKRHVCAACTKPIDGPHLRLYGHAHESDPPYTIRLHPGCAYPTDPKTGSALVKLEVGEAASRRTAPSEQLTGNIERTGTS